jgi:hypothetical protein
VILYAFVFAGNFLGCTDAFSGNFLGRTDLSGMLCPHALHLAAVKVGGIFCGLSEYAFLQFEQVICIVLFLINCVMVKWSGELPPNEVIDNKLQNPKQNRVKISI